LTVIPSYVRLALGPRFTFNVVSNLMPLYHQSTSGYLLTPESTALKGTSKCHGFFMPTSSPTQDCCTRLEGYNDHRRYVYTSLYKCQRRFPNHKSLYMISHVHNKNIATIYTIPFHANRLDRMIRKALPLRQICFSAESTFGIVFKASSRSFDLASNKWCKLYIC
jgi:hypothetical protein